MHPSDNHRELLQFLQNRRYFCVKVVPNRPQTQFVQVMENDTIKMYVHAVPEKWKANEELIRFLSNVLQIPKNRLEIISGSASQIKMVRILGAE